MNDSISTIFITILGAVALLVTASRYRQKEARLLMLSFVAHVSAGVGQVVITHGLYGYGDIFGYARKGEELAAALRLDFESVSVELIRVLFQQPGVLPFNIAGVGSSTGSMTAIAAFILFFTGGGVYTGCVVLGIASFYGKLAIYEVFRQNLPQRLHTKILVATLLIPSVVFWSSGLLKESVAMVGLGPVVLGLQRMFKRQFLSGALLLLFGAVTIAVVKAYILFAFVLAAGAWLYIVLAGDGRMPQLRPMHLVAGLAAAVLGLTVLSKIFPQYALDALAEQAALQQEVGQRAAGESTYTLIGDPAEATIVVQLAYAPLALMTSLYRPLIIEANSPQVFVNSLETTALLALTIMALWKVPLRSLRLALTGSPVAVFSLTFVIMFGIAVGLATTNLGTLSRYRMDAARAPAEAREGAGLVTGAGTRRVGLRSSESG
jgi:hypothetical protein